MRQRGGHKWASYTNIGHLLCYEPVNVTVVELGRGVVLVGGGHPGIGYWTQQEAKPEEVQELQGVSPAGAPPMPGCKA